MPDLIDNLKSIGMKTFVQYHEYFRNETYQNQEIISIMKRKENYTHNSASTKVSIGRRIIKTGRDKEALEAIIKSTNTEEQVRIDAERIYKKMYGI